jgi:hypothetical protein
LQGAETAAALDPVVDGLAERGDQVGMPVGHGRQHLSGRRGEGLADAGVQAAQLFGRARSRRQRGQQRRAQRLRIAQLGMADRHEFDGVARNAQVSDGHVHAVHGGSGQESDHPVGVHGFVAIAPTAPVQHVKLLLNLIDVMDG